jgi:hypothetical protein
VALQTDVDLYKRIMAWLTHQGIEVDRIYAKANNEAGKSLPSPGVCVSVGRVRNCLET